MFTSIGRFVVGHARLVLVVAGLVVVGAAVLGIGAFGKLQTGGFEDPGAESTKAAQLLSDRFDDSGRVLLVVQAKRGTVDGAAVAATGVRATRELRDKSGVEGVVSYWQTHDPSLRSTDGRYALVVGSVRSADSLDDADLDELRIDTAAARTSVGGDAAIDSDITAQVGRSLAIAETIAVPIILVLLVLAFGSVVAATLPLIIGAIAILGTFAELFVLGSITDVAVYAINLTTALGLALAIDYALLMVSRYREELATGASPPEAVIRSVQTAGRTIVFSAATVAAALAVLLIFPLYFLRSFAYAGIGVVIISAVGALVVLPALLTVLGHRVNAGRLPWARRRPPTTSAPIWGRIAGAAMRRPALLALPVVAVLLFLALPLRGVDFGTPDDRVLRTDTQSRIVGDALRDHFEGDAATEITVAVDGRATADDVRTYARSLSGLPAVALVRSSAGAFAHGAAAGPVNPAFARADTQRISVISTADPRSDAAKSLVRTLRTTPAPDGTRAYVGGQTAALIDSTHAIGSRLPIAALMVLATTFLVLFLFTGSVLQPIRSLVLNALTLGATGGLMVWIFQDGHLAGLLGFTPLPLDISMLVLLFCIGFGLSMDYEVIVLSRIKELHDHGADGTTSVTEGLTHSGRVVTTAAALIAVSFFAFGTASVSFLQLFGIGAGVAVLVDATLVRAVLVPACQRLLGRWAWYAPRPLRRLHGRIGLSEA